MRTRVASRLMAIAIVGASLGIGGAVTLGVGAASAHVTVNPREAARGGFAKLTFRVPNERANASTVKVEVTIPTESPISSVSVRPVPGWTVAVERAKLPTPVKTESGEIVEAVSKLTWTASEGSFIGAGQFQEFEISAGPLPDVEQIVFKALQTYSNGEVVRWIEEPADGAEEPEYPAPVLKLAAASGTGGAAPSQAAPNPGNATVSGSDDTSAADGNGDGNSGLALGFGVAGLIAGLAGLAFGLLAWRRAGSGTATTG
jgi:periplasmic copper chaperone A